METLSLQGRFGVIELPSANAFSPMAAPRLYLILLVGVLGLIGCGQDQSSHPAPSSKTADTSTPGSQASPTPTDTSTDALRVLVLGNSIAAGAGVPTEAAFPTRLQARVDSLGWNVEVQNAGVSGETTAGGRRRIGWLLENRVDVLILELGGNDGLRGVDPRTTRENLRSIIDTTLATYPDAEVLLAGMQIPPNLGPDYAQQFREVYPTVAEDYDRVTLIPFLLEDIAGADSLMQDDGIHPTAAGHRLIARTVWKKLRPLLEQMQKARPE